MIYVVPPHLQAFIANQGFDTLVLQPELLLSGEGLDGSSTRGLDHWLHRLADRLSDVNVRGVQAVGRELNRAIVQFDPALILLDAFSPYTYFFMEGKKPPTILLQIMLATRRRPGIPALNSPALPSAVSGRFSGLQVRWSWWAHNLSRRWKQWISLGDNNLQVTYRAFSDNRRLIKDQLDFNFAFHPGIRGLQELILAPKSMDYDEISPVKQLYLASSMNVQRQDFVTDPKVQELLLRMQVTHRDKVWIYCSLGTLNVSHNKNCWAFFREVMQAFALKKQWEVVIATGEMKPYQFGAQPANIHLFERVPQLEVLKYCRAMITHGGINSTLECINHLTPLLVYPLNDEWDQNGNSARVVHYGLGLRGSIRRARARNILAKLEQLVENPQYTERLRQMRDRINAEDGLEKAVALIRQLTIDCPAARLALPARPEMEMQAG